MIRALGGAVVAVLLLAGCTVTQSSDKFADDPAPVAAVRSSNELHWDLTSEIPIDGDEIWVISPGDEALDVELLLPTASASTTTAAATTTFATAADSVSITANGERLTSVAVFVRFDDPAELRDVLLAQEPSYGWGVDQIEGWYDDTAAASVNSTNSRVRVNMNGVSGDWDVSVELNRKSGESSPVTAMYTFYLP